MCNAFGAAAAQKVFVFTEVHVFDILTFDVAKFDSILVRGLSQGIGVQGQQVCIEAAICETLGLEHDDDPKCVAVAVRAFKIALNDMNDWSSPQARARGLRDLGLAQLGSLGIVHDTEFLKLLNALFTRVLVPDLFHRFETDKRESWEEIAEMVTAVSMANIATVRAAARTAEAARAAARTAEAARTAAIAGREAAWVAEAAQRVSAEVARLDVKQDYYLNLAARLATDVLRELKSPGVKLLG